MEPGDGSWDLKLLVTDLQVERTLRVRGEDHIGGVMLQLVDLLDIAMDWSDHAVWWPGKNCWLTTTRWTLDQYNVTADETLHFTPMHKTLRVQLPDLRFTDCRVDFSVKAFSAVVRLCRELEIRHPEELSFAKPLDSDHLKFNYGSVQAAERARRVTLAAMPVSPRHDTNTFIAVSDTLRRKSTTASPSPRKLSTMSRGGTPGRGGGSQYGSDWSLAMSPPPTEEARETIVRPKSLVEKARMNVAWLDSSLSVMEQGVTEFDTILLRYKYYNFYDLNPKEDPVRINLIYEQAKWQILNEEIDCTEEEMLLFASLQLQVGLQANVPQPQDEPEDDVESALNELQISLDGGYPAGRQENITLIPQLAGYLKYLKPKRFTLKGYKTSYFVIKDLQLSAWRGGQSGERGQQQAHFSIGLKGCEVQPDVNIHQGRYGIKLAVPSTDGMSDLWLRCDSESQYAQWLAACRLAAKGKGLADYGYEQEVSAIKAFLSMQHPATAPAINPTTLDISVEDYMAPRFLKRKSKLRQKILEAHANVKDLNLIEAKMNFIKAWQSLPEFGVSLFVVKFHGERREELLGIAYNRLMRLQLSSGEHTTTWRYNTVKAWNVNWETGYMMVQLGNGENVIFQCVSAECKVVHEFIGGYIFLSMRSKDSSQILNEELFHKLTGGWT